MIRDPASSKDIPLKMVGSTLFGRYPKISTETTYNMIISDGWLVPFAGHKKVGLRQSTLGRGIFNSSRGNFQIVVSDSDVYKVDSNLQETYIGALATSTGDVFMDENDVKQIAICDKRNIYIYNWGTGALTTASTDFAPGYVTFQDGYFIAPDVNNAQWRLSNLNNGMVWPADKRHVGTFQGKSDNPVACLRFPGGGNQLLIMGKTVTQIWMDVGLQIFPYQRASSVNIDYGCLNPATIASGEDFIVWLASNEKSGPTILVSKGGGNVQQISTDGINFRLSQLVNPENAYGMLYKQDGHLFYQLTFPGQQDNFSLLYDFTVDKFTSLCDENMNYHIAKRMAYFNNSYYFVSFQNGGLYELNSEYTTYDGQEIPRIRVCPSIRLPDTSSFRVNNLTFPIEQGFDSEVARVDMSVSVDGGVSYGNIVGMQLNALGVHKNQLIYWYNGLCNEFIPQFRFWGMNRFVVGDGVINIYK